MSADESVDAELGVELLWGFETVASMESESLEERPRPGAAEDGASYALENVLRTVGETALNVSGRSEEPLPKVRSC